MSCQCQAGHDYSCSCEAKLSISEFGIAVDRICCCSIQLECQKSFVDAMSNLASSALALEVLMKHIWLQT